MGRLRVTRLPLISLSLAISVAAPPVARASNSLVSVEVQRNGVAGVEGLAFASSVAVSSDGAHVYATGFLDNALVAFRRDAASGMLTFVGVQRDGVGGVDGLGRPHSLVVSPDGANVYVASGFDSTDADADQAVAVFRRDATTGALTFVEAKKQGEAGVDGLSGAAEVATSPDGLHVYVAAIRDGAVAVFARDGTTGALTFVEAKKQGLGGIDGLAGASSVVVAPDGGQVYVAGSASDAVVTFQRDASTGALSLFDVRRPEPLVAPVALAIAGNGEHLYAGDAHTHRGAAGGVPPPHPVGQGIDPSRQPARGRPKPDQVEVESRRRDLVRGVRQPHHDDRLCDLCLRRLQYRRRRAERPGPRRRHLRRDVVRTLLEDGWDARFPLQRQARNPRRDHADLPPCGRRRTSARDRVRKLRQLAARCSAVCTAGDGAAPGVQR